MANIGEVLQRLQQKDSERTVIQDDIEGLETFQSEGISGKLVITVLEGPARDGKLFIDVIDPSKEGTLYSVEKVT